jgi:hypothetical protein
LFTFIAEATGSENHIVEWLVIISTLALTLVSLALTWATWQVHKDSTKALSHDNDNMHDIAAREINSRHHEKLAQLRQLERRKRR